MADGIPGFDALFRTLHELYSAGFDISLALITNSLRHVEAFQFYEQRSDFQDTKSSEHQDTTNPRYIFVTTGKMSDKKTSELSKRLCRKNLKNYAKYLAEHGDQAQHLPELRLDHQEYFQRCLEYYIALPGRNSIPISHTHRLPFLHHLDQPTFVISTLLNLLGCSCELSGEKSNVIKFLKQPLSSHLWITGFPRKPQDASENNILWRQIRLHTLNTSKHLNLHGPADLISIFGYVAASYASFTSSHLDVDIRIKATKPKRFRDDKLLNTLCQLKYTRGQPGSARFTEAARQVKNGCLLDAVVELFTPFIGVLPRSFSGFVDFHHSSEQRRNFLNEVQIWHAKDIYPRHLVGLETCVLVSGLTFPGGDEDEETDEEEEAEHMSRRFSKWLQGHGSKVLPELHSRYLEAFLYDLASPSERCELVLRVLDERDRQERVFKREVAELKVIGNWEGKYCPRWRYEMNGIKARRDGRLRECRERLSKLRFCVTNEVEEARVCEGTNRKRSWAAMMQLSEAVTTLCIEIQGEEGAQSSFTATSEKKPQLL